MFSRSNTSLAEREILNRLDACQVRRAKVVLLLRISQALDHHPGVLGTDRVRMPRADRKAAAGIVMISQRPWLKDVGALHKVSLRNLRLLVPSADHWRMAVHQFLPRPRRFLMHGLEVTADPVLPGILMATCPSPFKRPIKWKTQYPQGLPRSPLLQSTRPLR